MTVVIEASESHFGVSYIVTATKDKYHRTIVREFYSYADAYLFGKDLLAEKLDAHTLSLFKRKGI